jgi:hypothetical protein
MSDLTGRPIVTNVTGEPWGYGLQRPLEVKAQRDLTCTVAGAFAVCAVVRAPKEAGLLMSVVGGGNPTFMTRSAK